MAALTTDFSAAFQAWNGVGEGHPAFLGFAMLGVGGALAFWSRALAGWAIATGPEGCPRCGYAKIEQEVCPECGLRGFRQP